MPSLNKRYDKYLKLHGYYPLYDTYPPSIMDNMPFPKPIRQIIYQYLRQETLWINKYDECRKWMENEDIIFRTRYCHYKNKYDCCGGCGILIPRKIEERFMRIGGIGNVIVVDRHHYGELSDEEFNLLPNQLRMDGSGCIRENRPNGIEFDTHPEDIGMRPQELKPYLRY